MPMRSAPSFPPPSSSSSPSFAGLFFLALQLPCLSLTAIPPRLVKPTGPGRSRSNPTRLPPTAAIVDGFQRNPSRQPRLTVARVKPAWQWPLRLAMAEPPLISSPLSYSSSSSSSPPFPTAAVPSRSSSRRFTLAASRRQQHPVASDSCPSASFFFFFFRLFFLLLPLLSLSLFSTPLPSVSSLFLSHSVSPVLSLCTSSMYLSLSLSLSRSLTLWVSLSVSLLISPSLALFHSLSLGVSLSSSPFL